MAAAINFAKNDESVEVHEARKDIGMQFHPNYQVLLKESPETPASESDAKSYLNRWGLESTIPVQGCKEIPVLYTKARFYDLSKRTIAIDSQRG